MILRCRPTFQLHSKLASKRPWLIGTALLVGLLTLFSARNSVAANGDRITLPISRANIPTFSKQSGIQILVDSTWAGDRGYRPVRVTAAMATAVTSDTQITIQFYAGSWMSGDRTISVESDFELTQGSISATTQFLVPKHSDWNVFGWDVWVDGVKDKALCQTPMGYNSGTNGATAVGRFESVNGQWNRQGTAFLQTLSSNAIEEQVFDISTLPEQWVEYSPLDVVTTNISALELARVSTPRKLNALLRWVRAGGNLWVMDTGEDYEELTTLDKILGSEQKNNSEPSEGNSPAANWRFLDLSGTGRKRLDDLVTLSMDQPTDSHLLSRTEIADSRFADTAVDSREWFVARGYGLGTIVAFQESNSSRRRRGNGVNTALQRSSLSSNLQWTTRHGNDPGSGNPNFNNLLIADVGTAPVFEFQMLITLFVIGIGPVNYWLLKRRNQLPALLLTVPIAALAATVMLFTYGFLADGIGANVRARSLTVLDQRAGEAATWARLSYYSGIAPSDGLEMPKDTAVYPILPSRSESTLFGRRHINQQRALEWGQQQYLTRGWLASRTPTQYLTVSARSTKKRLEFEPKPESLQVTNRLGIELVALIAQDHEGNIFLGEENVDAEGKALLKSSNFVEAGAVLRKYMTENIPQLPPGYVEGNRSRRNDYGASMTESLMELQLEAISSPQAKGWGNGSYIAITSAGIELDLGLSDIEESNSFHVVRGAW